MGDRHGGRFARRGRALNPPHPHIDAHRGVDFRWRATVLRCRGAVGRICPTQERSPRRKPPDTARRRKNLPPREKALLGEGIPTRRTGERICPARERSPRRRHPDTAHERKDLPHARTLSSAKASRHGARAKGFAPREKAPLGEGFPTRRTNENICPAQKHAPRRKPPDTAHERKDLPRGVRPRPTCRRTAGRPRPMPRKKNTPSAGSHPQRAAAAEFIHRKK